MSLFYFILLFFAGLPLFLTGRKQLIKARRGRNWPTTEAKVTQSRVDKKEKRRRASSWIQYDAIVAYSYTMEGEVHQGKQTYFGTFKKEKLMELVANYPIGKNNYHPH